VRERLIVTQGSHGVDASGPPGWEVACDKGHGAEQRHRCHEADWIKFAQSGVSNTPFSLIVCGITLLYRKEEVLFWGLIY
jgi:hypothetical protein